MREHISSSCLGLLMMASAIAVGAEDAPTAKALFYSTQGELLLASNPISAKTSKPLPISSSNNPTKLGLKYFIRLKGSDGKTSNVLASRIFKSGERFQVGLNTAGPTYIYVVNEDNSGQKKVLFPQPGQSSYVNAEGTVFLPQKGAFEFDGIPGIEKLTIIVSRHEIEQLENFVHSDTPDFVADSTSSSPYLLASKGISFSNDSSSKPGYEAATYVMKQPVSPNEVLHVTIKLVHK